MNYCAIANDHDRPSKSFQRFYLSTSWTKDQWTLQLNLIDFLWSCLRHQIWKL